MARAGLAQRGRAALDPQQPDTLYCGTGEANLSADSHAGVGVYRSVDAGASWMLLAPADVAGLPRRIGALAVDPFDSTHLLAGGLGHVFGEATGLFRSTDGGTTWTGVPLAGSVNLSGRQLAAPDLVTIVTEGLAASGLPPELLCLEITESVLMSDLDTTIGALGALRGLGV
ncbi:MAG: hypothetical protein L0H84_06330, partial [Pseudonocardia sp.]|nr:hypothetical protein [Pseudonocardia sp.]